MPKRASKISKKTHEEKTAENFFPVDEGDLKRAIEKEYKKPNEESLIRNLELKGGGYELVITEKPQAAAKIASALGKAVQKNFNKIPYYEVNRGEKKSWLHVQWGIYSLSNRMLPERMGQSLT